MLIIFKINSLNDIFIYIELVILFKYNYCNHCVQINYIMAFCVYFCQIRYENVYIYYSQSLYLIDCECIYFTNYCIYIYTSNHILMFLQCIHSVFGYMCI